MIHLFLAVACLAAPEQQPLTGVETAHAAISLLPRKPAVQVVLVNVDRDLPPEKRDAYRDLVGFTFPGYRPDVYLNTRSPMFQEARADEFYRYALAAIIEHELAHLAGADETRARRNEEQLWSTFIANGRVDRERAMQHAVQMASRHRKEPDENAADKERQASGLTVDESGRIRRHEGREQ